MTNRMVIGMTTAAYTSQIVVGLTNIELVNTLAGGAWATFQITTPATANVITNYVPANEFEDVLT
ncbi:MAG TPA: hypothetical protein VMF08_08495 [Candidatus Sulfotelmatobacter sp.]|nr:hypothetical protein [Candidatus Sulfotelmatobacter sp.]